MRTLWLKLLAASAMLVPFAASAYNFVPTRLEFASWPKYCQARYVETMIGRTSEFVPLVPPPERRAAEAAIGRDTYEPVHHHCAGILWLARAKLETSPQARKHALTRAIDESSYTWQSITPASPLYSSVAANLARAEEALGNIDQAEKYYEEAITRKPTDALPYIGLAILYKDTKRLELARTMLEKGLSAVEGNIDLHYNLGLICLELKDTECAQQHARAAYDQGYPLPGLKRKLADAGLRLE